MILVRNVFRLKYGQARPALALLKEARPMFERMSTATHTRIMTDLVGPAYTLVFEDTFPNLSAWEAEMQMVMQGPDADTWRGWYQKFTPLVDSGYREIFTIIE